MTHKEIPNLATIVATADIVVIAAGSAYLVRGEWSKEGAVVIDVGINRIRDAQGRACIAGHTAAE